VKGTEQPVRKDGLGMLAIVPQCEQTCEIRLDYQAVEKWPTLLASAMIMAGAAITGIYRRARKASGNLDR
jgi:hypothetical protein